MQKYPWTDAEVDDLCANYGQERAEDIAARLGRTREAVMLKAAAVGVARERHGVQKPWSAWEAGILRLMYPTHRAQDIAAILRRSLLSVKGRVRILRLQKQKSHKMRHWSAVEEVALRTWYAEGWALDDIARQLNRTIDAIGMRLDKMGVRNDRLVYPVGYEYTDRHGLRHRKVGNARGKSKKADNWKRIDVIDWEAVNGPLPAGHTLIVVNSYLPRTPSNMRLIRKDELWATVTGAYLPPEARELLVLKRQIEQEAKKQRKK